MRTLSKALLLGALWLLVGPTTAAAQSRSAVGSASYDELQASTGFWRETSAALPGAYQLYLQSEQSLGGLWGLGPRPAGVDRDSFAADAHAGMAGYYPARSCVDCHDGLDRNLHSSRTPVTCRQCHRAEPIAGVFHYYSELNPIRRHAYVCAKCHEGATANFAAYVVHEPNPLASTTAEGFPALYYGAWFMVIVAGGVFAFFIPYVSIWSVRELVAKLRGGLRHGHV